MNSKKVQDVLLPAIIVVVFMSISYAVAELIPERTWSNILLLGSMELVCIYSIVISNFNKNRQRFMCLVLSLQFSLYTIPYSVFTWVYFNFNFETVDAVQYSMFIMYEPISNTVCALLLLIACVPGNLINGFSARARIDFHLSRINHGLGIYLFSVDKAEQ